jgi:hypothetical protein
MSARFRDQTQIFGGCGPFAKAQDGSRVFILTTNEDARAVRPDRLVVWVSLCDSEDFSGLVYLSLIILRNDKGARENEATD